MLYGGYINKNKLFILGGFLENGEYCRNVYAIDLISSKVKENILSFDIAAIAPKCLKWQNKILIVGS